MKAVTLERVKSAITAVLESPNKSGERAGLFVRLHKLREKLERECDQCDFCGELKEGPFLEIYDDNYNEIVAIQCEACRKQEEQD